MTTHASTTSRTSKSNILEKLERDVKGADYSKLPKEKDFQYPALSKQQQIEQFTRMLEASHAEVLSIDAQQIPEVVNGILKNRGINTLLCGNSSLLEKHVRALNDEIDIQYFDFDLSEAENKEKLFNTMPASLTSSHAAIAATGTIVLWPNENEPRSLSLVPPIHIVVVAENTLYQDFASLLTEQRLKDKMPTNIVLVSGPSKTADIQQTLAYGAHGPKELIVLLVK